MAGNHVAHLDQSIGSNRSKKKLASLRTLSETNEISSIYSTRVSSKAPSIVQLENLQMDGENGYEVPNSNRDHDKAIIKRHLPAFPHKVPNHRKLTKVYVSMVFLKIGQIETIKEYYEADIFIKAKWREPLLDTSQVKVTNFKEFWNPKLFVRNIFDDPKEQVWHEVHYGKYHEAYIHEMRRIKGKFEETMELNEFPFDVQSISLVVSTELTCDLVQVLEDKEEVSSIHTECFSDSQEWKLFDYVELSPLEISSEFSRTKKNYSGQVATCCVSRRSGFFAWNVLVIVNLLNIFAFTTFAVSPTLPQNRLQLSFILVLAGISFRFVTNQSIPKISYLTHLDRYVLISMVFSACITFWHALLTRFDYSLDLQETMDFWAFIIFAVAYFVFQCIFIFIMLWQRHLKLKEIRGKEASYKTKAQSVFGDFWGVLRREVGLRRSQRRRLGVRRRSDVHIIPRT